MTANRLDCLAILQGSSGVSARRGGADHVPPAEYQGPLLRCQSGMIGHEMLEYGLPVAQRFLQHEAIKEVDEGALIQVWPAPVDLAQDPAQVALETALLGVVE